MTVPSPATVRCLQVGVLDDVLAAEIDRLAFNAVEPNPFYESWYLRLTLEFLTTEPLLLVLIHSASGQLICVLPLTPRARFKRLPLRNLRSWTHDYTFLAAPLVHRDHVEEAIAGLLDWCASRRAPSGILELVNIRMDGPIAAALEASISAHHTQLLARQTRWTRAMYRLDIPDDPEYMSAKQRSGFRRKERRLAEEGAVAYRRMETGDDPMAWIERFLEVEASGWKGREGTAMATSDRDFFIAVCCQAHARDQLHMLALELDGKPIAMKCNFLAGSQAFTFKIAYDEAYARFSPGVLIELYQMHHLREVHPQLKAVDSCTVADNTMFPGLWSGECVLGDFAILRNNRFHRMLLGHGARLMQAFVRRRAVPTS
ncbi:GNAT family N-acetyltransferase [Novilysobacter antarcticus]|uniref:GNAT family N-acetyltransferase n=1 Tax=Novilysobacter antarcticus TaxID=2862543 RepID=UPI001C9999A8|nr:GNAT family N-acetyltransferase [Lysobacter antarcticus]